MDIQYKIKALEPFKDGNVWPERVALGQILVVPEWKYNQFIQSGGKFEVLEKVVPNPKKVKRDEAEG